MSKETVAAFLDRIKPILDRHVGAALIAFLAIKDYPQESDPRPWWWVAIVFVCIWSIFLRIFKKP